MALDLDLNDVSVFLRITELGTLSAAARERHLPVSAVSRALQRLEAQCGTRLMHRSTHGLSLTDEGDTFAAYARQLIDTRDALAGVLSGKQDGPSGWVRVSVSPTVATAVVVPSLPSLYARYPQLHVEVLAEDRMLDMAREGVDIAVRTGVLGHDNIIARSLGEFSRQLYAAPAYVARHGMPTHPDDLAQHHLITNSAIPALSRWPWGPRAQQPPGAVYLAQGQTRTDNSDVLSSLVLAGVGIGWLNDLLIQAHLERGELLPVLSDWFAHNRVPMYAAMLPERHRLPKLKACIDHWTLWLKGGATPATDNPQP